MTVMATPEVEDFSAESYRELQLRIPGMDGYQADTLALSFGGTVELDRTFEDHLALMEQLKLGQGITLTVEAVVAGKTFTHADKGEIEGEKVGHRIALKVQAVTA